MKVFGGSILSHYSRWCPVQARLVQSLETKWEGKRERQRKAKREKDVGYSLNSLFVSVIYTSKIVLGGKGLTNSFFPPRSAATHLARFLDVSWKPKLGCFFIISGLVKLFSRLCAGATMDLSNHIHASTPRFASRISHRCNIGPRPAWHPYPPAHQHHYQNTHT